MIERILWLLAYPKATFKQYFEKFEMTKRTFYRDKQYINERLWNYKVEIIK